MPECDLLAPAPRAWAHFGHKMPARPVIWRNAVLPICAAQAAFTALTCMAEIGSSPTGGTAGASALRSYEWPAAPSSRDAAAAVDPDHLPGDVAGVLVEQRADDVSDLARRSDAAHRNRCE